MADVAAVAKVVGTFSVTVTRCGCDPRPGAHAFLDPPQPCPTPKSVELAVERDIVQTIEGELIVKENATDGNDTSR